MKKLKKLSLTIGTAALAATGVGAIATVSLTTNTNVNNVLTAANNTASNMLGASANQSNFDSSKASVALVKQQYAWKRSQFDFKDNVLHSLDTSISKFENKQKRHWKISKEKLECNDNSAVKYTLHQNHPSNNNVRAILMQYELSYEVPANSTIDTIVKSKINGQLKIEGSGAGPTGAVEVGFSNVSDNPESSFTIGNAWINLNIDRKEKTDDAKNFNKDNKFLYIWRNYNTADQFYDFDNSNSQIITFKNDSNETKTVKKYLNLYVLSSSWLNNKNLPYHNIDNAEVSVNIADANAAKISEIQQIEERSAVKWVQTTVNGHKELKQLYELYRKVGADTRITTNEILNSKERIKDQWNFASKHSIFDSSKTQKIHYEFSTKERTKQWNKILFLTNAVTVYLPAHSKKTLSVEDIKYNLDCTLEGKTAFWDVLGAFGLGISPIYERIDSRPNINIGINYEAEWDPDNHYRSVNTWDQGNGAGIAFLPCYKSFLWNDGHRHYTEKSKPCTDETYEHGNPNRTLMKNKEQNRQFVLENNTDEPVEKTVYFDCWVQCSAFLGMEDNLHLVKGCVELGKSFLEFDVKLS